MDQSTWIAPTLVTASEYAGSAEQRAKKGCGCQVKAQAGTVSELQKAVSQNPILYLLGAFALGYCLKGKK